jgi:hypothetical protein
MAEESKSAERQAKEQAAAAAQQAQQQAGFPTDYSNLSTVYTNFCRVNVTPEELVLDFGLNTQLTPNPTEPVHLTHRVVMNFYTAKRLLNALAAVVNQHERNYGALELDFQRRAGAAMRGGTSGAGGGG